jgi:hypothetical protein
VDASDDHLFSDTDDDFLSMPVIFFGAIQPAGSGSEIYPRNSIAFTPGLANFQPASQDLVVFPKPFMPKVTPTGATMPIDLFGASVEHVMDQSTVPRVKFADDWDKYHRQDGEVHCGTAAKRIIYTMPWWGMLP